MSAITQTGPESWTIQGKSLTLPVEIRDARLAVSIYRTPAGDAKAMLAATPFRPLVIGGSAFSVVIFVRYLDGDLGCYDEFGIGTAVHGVKGAPGAYVHHLPVTEEFTKFAGRWIWGLPKYVVHSGSNVESRQVRIDLSTEDQFMVAGTMQASIRVPGRFSVRTAGWSTSIEGPAQGDVLMTPSRMTMTDVRIGRSGTELSWGDHPIGKDAHALRLHGKPLFTVTGRVRVSIDAAVRLRRVQS